MQPHRTTAADKVAEAPVVHAMVQATMQATMQATILPSTCFTSRKFNPTTFLIIEDDSFGEHPHVYVKIYPDVLVICDTGCNSPRVSGLLVTHLREYIENYPFPSNDDQPLNPRGRKGYLIILSHCHYDHILGIEQFEGPNTTIVASNYSKSFIEKDLATHSLCRYLNIPTPLYKVNHWARNLEHLSYKRAPTSLAFPLRIQFLHVPGHTPDSLAWYDIDEHHLYVGDTFYYQYRSHPLQIISPESPQPGKAPIIFPAEGNWAEYQTSLALLFEFTTRQNHILRQKQNYDPSPTNQAPRVLVSSGHSTLAADAETMISSVQSFFMRIMGNAIPVVESVVRRDEIYDLWEDEDDDGFSVLAPRRLVEEARGRLG